MNANRNFPSTLMHKSGNTKNAPFSPDRSDRRYADDTSVPKSVRWTGGDGPVLDGGRFGGDCEGSCCRSGAVCEEEYDGARLREMLDGFPGYSVACWTD